MVSEKQLPDGWMEWDDHARRTAIYHKWNVVREIKRRCHNADVNDMARINELVYMYRALFPGAHLRASACQIPQIVGTIAKYLHGCGLIESPYVR